MPSLLSVLRETAQPSPGRFLAAQPGCWLVYRNDAPDRAASRSLQASSFDPEAARALQVAGWGVFHTLHAFGASPSDGSLLCLRNFGVEVTLAAPSEERAVSSRDLDLRKEEYLGGWLLRFPLRPHWLAETREGFQAVFRIRPVRGKRAALDALVINRWLAAALGGDAGTVRLTQTLRVPGTWQFTDPHAPWLCRLLEDRADRAPPYGIEEMRSALANWRGCQRSGDGSFLTA
jgi:hypothetical protein